MAPRYDFYSVNSVFCTYEQISSSCEFNKVVTSILGKTEFSVDFENTGENIQDLGQV